MLYVALVLLSNAGQESGPIAMGELQKFTNGGQRVKAIAALAEKERDDSTTKTKSPET